MRVESVHRQSVRGVEMLIAIDSTRRGPALGGCRWKPYPDLAAARADALSLARAMTLKAGLARLRLGGGKAVVIGDPRRRTRAQMLAFGELVESLDGRYVTAADMGTGAEEMAIFAERTRHVVGLPQRLGGCGDPGPWTARGVLLALETGLAGSGRKLDGLHVAVQGAGSVGAELIHLLLTRGARVSAADPDRAALASLPSEVRVIDPDRILELEADVLAPCGPPRVIDRVWAERLAVGMVCGAANNPLADASVAQLLAERGILVVPDYLANAGGLIFLAVAREGGGTRDVTRHLEIIRENLERVLERAKTCGTTPLAAAEQISLESIEAAG
jgi:glutamate dehydrogenase/leucine dehydrogenase